MECQHNFLMQASNGGLQCRDCHALLFNGMEEPPKAPTTPAKPLQTDYSDRYDEELQSYNAVKNHEQEMVHVLRDIRNLLAILIEKQKPKTKAKEKKND